MPFTPEEIEVKEFVTRFRGYDREEVHAFLRALAADMRRGQRQTPPGAKDRPNPQVLRQEGRPARVRNAKLLSLVEVQRAALASLLELLELRLEHLDEADRDRARLIRQARATCQTLDTVSSRALVLNRALDEVQAGSLGQSVPNTTDKTMIEGNGIYWPREAVPDLLPEGHYRLRKPSSDQRRGA